MTLPDQSDSPPMVMRAGDAARYLGVSLSSVHRWTRTGALPSLRTPGHQRRFSPADLDKFLAALREGDR